MEIIIVALVIAGLVLVFTGGIRTFKRNWLLALLTFLFLAPIWLAWAFVELFIDPPKPKIGQQAIVVNVVQSQNEKIDPSI